MSRTLSIESYEHPAGLVVILRGDLDASSTTAFDELITGLIKAPPPAGLVVFDCSEVPLMGSLAMGAFIRIHRAYLREHRSVRLATLTPPVHGALRHARLHTFFEIYDTVEGALGQIVG